jgi:hypothetical protein
MRARWDLLGDTAQGPPSLACSTLFSRVLLKPDGNQISYQISYQVAGGPQDGGSLLPQRLFGRKKP